MNQRIKMKLVMRGHRKHEESSQKQVHGNICREVKFSIDLPRWPGRQDLINSHQVAILAMTLSSQHEEDYLHMPKLPCSQHEEDSEPLADTEVKETRTEDQDASCFTDHNDVRVSWPLHAHAQHPIGAPLLNHGDRQRALHQHYSIDHYHYSHLRLVFTFLCCHWKSEKKSAKHPQLASLVSFNREHRSSCSRLVFPNLPGHHGIVCLPFLLFISTKN